MTLESKRTGSSDSLLSLQLIKISLAFFLLGICVVGRRETTWPMITWILYSGGSPRFRPPEPSISIVELRAYTAAGDLHVVKPEQLLSIPYDSLSHDIVEQAFSDTDTPVRDESRRYLAGAVSRLIDADSEIQTIQAWNLSYQIDPLEVPPIQRQSPATEMMLGSFSKEDSPKTNSTR